MAKTSGTKAGSPAADASAAPGPAVGNVLRQPAEVMYAAELAALAAADKDPKPAGWKLSPRAVRSFICGSDTPRVARKYFGDDALVERSIVTLAGNRGLLLVGDPGTAKSMLSELLSAAISGDSTNTIQGSAGTTEDQIKYSWNYALLLAEGPTLRALVEAPLYVGMKQGRLVRFEEITRCPPEIQDTLVSVISDKTMIVPELKDEHRVLLAAPGFNVIGTANLRDRGVHEMSSALKRRFNFETVEPIRELRLEVELVTRECERLLAGSGATVELPADVVEVLVTAFHDLREGRTAEGTSVEKPTAVMSTAEAVSVAFSASLDGYYFGQRRLSSELVARHLPTAALKDNPEDVAKLRHYFDTVVQQRSKAGSAAWKALYEARKVLR